MNHKKRLIKLSYHQKIMLREYILRLVKITKSKIENKPYVIIASNNDVYYITSYPNKNNKKNATKILKLKYNGTMYNIFKKTLEKNIAKDNLGVIYE